ncbi:hypothetical protein DL96DRAFT_33549 [Flagelloscypha sp. PMI_526]|nr:hypothetical protein DL96DRAFT_33549 [Flagelloscypha sp. PMI_526]
MSNPPPKKHSRRFSILGFGGGSHSRHGSEAAPSQVTSTPSSPSTSPPRALKTSASSEEIGRGSFSRRRSKLVRNPRRKLSLLFGDKSIREIEASDPVQPTTVQEEEEVLPTFSRRNSVASQAANVHQPSEPEAVSPTQLPSPSPHPHDIPLPPSSTASPEQDVCAAFDSFSGDRPPVEVANILTDCETAGMAHLAAKLEERISLDLLDLSPSQPEEHVVPQAKRRQSLDLTTLSSTTNMIHTPPSLGRSKTLYTPQRPGISDRENRRSDDLPRARAEMSARQRQIHVRRAQKISKVFGDDPPQELIHITADDMAGLKPHQRDSLLTLLSIDISLNSVSLESEHSNSGLKPPESPLPDRPPSATPSHDSDQRSSSQPQLIVQDIDEREIFALRRRRAAKLSKFFGVGHLATSLLERDQPDVQPAAPPSPVRTIGVDVKVVHHSGRRMWGLLEGQSPREADMQDVINQLRGLKSS